MIIDYSSCMLQNRKSCYCAFCKNQRKVYSSKHVNLFGVVSLIVLSYLMTFIIWGEPDVRGLAIMGLLLVVAEGFSQLRWRQALICRHCGFDPIVYLKNPDQAAEKIQNFLAYRQDRPEYLLRPAVKLPVKRVPSPVEIAKGQNLSLRG